MPDMLEKAYTEVVSRALAEKKAFFAVFFVVFALSYAFLYAIDFIPERPSERAPSVITSTPQTGINEIPRENIDPLPVRILIDELEKDYPVLNPESRAIADLDAALLDGVVRHPDSADFKDEGNIFLFGHSSYLPTVHNKNYQAFNGIQHLVRGDEVRLQSSDTEYVYRVTRVYKTKASEAEIALDHSKAKLTLVTCNSFGSKDDRFVVEAELVSKRAL